MSAIINNGVRTQSYLLTTIERVGVEGFVSSDFVAGIYDGGAMRAWTLRCLFPRIMAKSS
jgi:hypothetical protein